MPKQISSKKIIDDDESKSLSDFKKNKSISLTTNITDIKKKSSVGEIYSLKPLHNKIQNLCSNKISVHKINNLPIDKKVSKNICECLFEKNKNLSINDLENRINNKKDTPGSQCITILDNYAYKLTKKNKKGSRSSKSKSSKSKSSKSKSSKSKSRKSKSRK